MPLMRRDCFADSSTRPRPAQAHLTRLPVLHAAGRGLSRSRSGLGHHVEANGDGGGQHALRHVLREQQELVTHPRRRGIRASLRGDCGVIQVDQADAGRMVNRSFFFAPPFAAFFFAGVGMV